MDELNGIDVSYWQGKIDFQKVKESGIDFIIIKAGGSDAGIYIDPYFEHNYIEAKLAGLLVGAYYFVGKNCVTAPDGLADAERFVKLLSGKTLEMPTFVDVETTPNTLREGTTKAVIAFCKHMESCGFYIGIYGSDIATFQDKLDNSKLEAFDHWVARYSCPPKYVTEYGMWQYSNIGIVPGISGSVDLNKAYKDYTGIIKSHKLNGF